MRPVKAGFVGFGEVNTPREIINDKCDKAVNLLKKMEIELTVTAPVSDDPEYSEADRAIAELKDSDFDLLIICIAGWIPSHTVVRVSEEFKHLPILLWGLTGYYRDKRLVTTADQAGTSALRKPFEDFGYTYKYVYSRIDDGPPLEAIKSFAHAARAKNLVRHSKIGMMGYRDMDLYGTMFDGVSLKKTLGVEIEFFEMLEMAQRIEKLQEQDIDACIRSIEKAWEFENEVKRETLSKGVGLYLAVKQKIEERKYSAVSLIDVDGVKKLMNFPPAMTFMLLGEDPGVCTIPENDALGAVTQVITKMLTGQCAAYMEFYEFMQDRLLTGVPDFVPTEVVDGNVKVRATSFGGFGEGLLNISKVKTGRVTLARLTYSGDRYAMHLVTGEAVEPRSWEEAGWDPPAPQLPSLEVVLDSPVEEFAEKVIAQHYIISYGDNTALFKDFCRIHDIDMY